MTRWPPIWRTVPWARRYAVSDAGQVRNGAGPLAVRLNDEGYPKVKLVCDDGRRRDFFVHVLVARLHLPPPRWDQRYVLHRHGMRTDCRAANLRWGTHAENHQDKLDHGSVRPVVRKLTARQVRAIRASSLGAAPIARRFGLSIVHVRDIRNGRRWKVLDDRRVST